MRFMTKQTYLWPGRALLFLVLSCVLSMHLIAGHVVELEKVPGDVYIYGSPLNAFGFALASGDVNGDGFEDLIVGDPGLVGPGGNQGGCYVFFGRKLTSPSTIIDLGIDNADITIHGLTTSAELGQAVAAGDINGDGIDDIVLGEKQGVAPGSTISHGRVHVIYGDENLVSPVTINLMVQPADLMVNEDITGKYAYVSNLGSAVAAKDFNGDGIDDLFMGASHLAFPGSGMVPGGAFMVYGSDSFPPNHIIDLGVTDPALTVLGIGEIGDYENTGKYITGGDLNGDGYDEFIVCSPDLSFNKPGQGVAYVVNGGPDLQAGTFIDFANTPPSMMILGESSNDHLGPVACGDVNNDGFDDLICGAPIYSIVGDPKGRVYVIFGKSSFPPNYIKWLGYDLADVTIQGGFGDLGFSVASGDVSGDGIDDILMGNHYGGEPGYGNGITDVIFGHELLGNQPFIDFSVDQSDIRVVGKIDTAMGSCVCACDFNGDGFSEIVPSSTGGGPGSWNGAAYVIVSGGAKAYGNGLEGSGGVTPVLSNTADELPVISTGTVEIAITDGFGGSSGIIMAGSEKGSFFFYGGLLLLDPMSIFLAMPIKLSNPGGGPGTGSISIPSAIPDIPGLSLTAIYFQAAFSDPGAVMGVSLTKGLQMSFLSKGQ